MRWTSFVCLLLLLSFGTAAQAQDTGTIVGAVVNTAGGALSGAQVYVEGTGFGSLSNAQGNYRIENVPAGPVVVRVQLLGYAERAQPATVTAGGTISVNFQMTESAIQLEELVATGYGSQQKVNLTGAVAAVGGEEIAALPVPNVSSALQGLAPGLQVIDNGGNPGANGGDILIRGQTTLGGGGIDGVSRGRSRPLVLIDGIEGNMDQLDLEEVESISVLKDASSAAIYGSRAANGVILITTKRGQARQGMQITYDGYYGIQNITAFPEHVSVADHMRLTNLAYENAGLAPKYSQEYMQCTISGEDPINCPTTDWVDELFDPAPIQDHTLRISGGSDAARYALSLNYLDEGGMVPNTGADRYGVRLNTDFNPTDRISGGLDLSANRRWRVNPSLNWETYFFLIHDTPPTVSAQYPDGTWGWSDTGRNPVAYASESGQRERATWLGTATGRFNVDLVPTWVELQTTASFTYDHYTNQEFRTEEAFYDYFDPNLLRQGWGPNNLWRDTNDGQQLTLRALLDFGHVFNDTHDVSGIFGYEQIEQQNDWFGAHRQDFYNNDLQQLDLGNAEFDSNWGGSSEWALRSVFGRLGYSYMGRYLFEANARYDGSSRFAEGNRYGFFPSFSAAWRLSEESFFNVDWINELKFRGSWGQLGNQDVGLYQYYSTITLTQPYFFGGQLHTGAAKTSLTNQDITWETTTASNFGLDAVFLDNRLSFSADYYVRRTEDILLQLPVPETVGRAASTQNAGVVENRGYELALGWADAFGDFNYRMDFNFSDNTNEVIDLAGTGPYVGWDEVIMEGHPINSWFMYEADGLFQSQEEVDAHAVQPGNTKPGDIRWVDQNGDGIINEQDKTVVGDPNPHYLFGFNFAANWHDWDFSMFVQGVGKRDQRIELGLAEGPMWENYTTTWHLDYWTPDNPDARVPQPTIYENYNTHYPSTWYMTDASYVKLRNVQLGYTLPPQFTQGFGVDRLRVYVSGKNLFQASGMEIGLDPEVPWVRGDYYPQTKSFSIGTNVVF